MKVRAFQRFARFGGLFNIIAAVPLATPWTMDVYLRLIGGLNRSLGLGGTLWLDVNHPVHRFLVMTAGIDLVLVGVLVLWAAHVPVQRKSLFVYNAAARLIWTAFMIYFVVVFNLWPIFLVFGLTDIVISIVFLRFACSGRRRIAPV